MNTLKHEFTQSTTEGNWRIFVSPSTNYGYFENTLTELQGGLWFKGATVIEFDGVYELPRNVVKALRRLRKKFDNYILP